MKTREKDMQRFLIFVLVVVLVCIVLTRFFMDGLDPVEFMASTQPFALPLEEPVFNNGEVLLELKWTEVQMVYLYKIIMLVVIVLVAVLNYRSFISEAEDENS